jgi:ribosomal protein S18 acetylase RimI-like enzyme
MVTVQTANIQDISAIRRVLKETWLATYGSLFSLEQIDRITGNWHAPERIEFSIHDPNTYIAVAKDDTGDIVGMVSARRAGALLTLDRLYVLPSFQGQGIGTELLNRALGAFTGVAAAELEVEEMNTPAIGFYQRQGFTERERVKEMVEGVTLKAIKMQRQF